MTNYVRVTNQMTNYEFPIRHLIGYIYRVSEKVQ